MKRNKVEWTVGKKESEMEREIKERKKTGRGSEMISKESIKK